MAAPRPDDLTVSPIGGAVLSEIPAGRTSTMGVYVQVRGVGVTSDSATATVTRGGVSVSLTPTIASGEVSISISAANLATLGASVGSSLTAWLSGEVTDGANTLTWEYQALLQVSDRLLRLPFDYARFLARMRVFGRACSIPSGQTSHWDQIEVGLGDFRDWLNSQTADISTAILAREGLLRQGAELWGTIPVLEGAVMATAASLKDSPLGMALMDARQRRDEWCASAVVVTRDGSGWGTEGAQREVQAKTPPGYVRPRIGIGGAL